MLSLSRFAIVAVAVFAAVAVAVVYGFVVVAAITAVTVANRSGKSQRGCVHGVCVRGVEGEDATHPVLLMLMPLWRPPAGGPPPLELMVC